MCKKHWVQYYALLFVPPSFLNWKGSNFSELLERV